MARGPTQWGGAFAPYKRFGLRPKTLAQGEFTSPEHLKGKGGGGKKPPEPKKKDSLSEFLF